MYKWFVVAMLWFVCLFNYADRQAIYSVFPLLKTEMRLSDVQLGVVGASFMWVYAAAAPFAGMIGDRSSRKALILGGLIFWSIVTIATALSRTYWHLVLFRALEGLGEAFYFPASMSMLSDYHGRGTRSRAMSLHQSSVYAGTIAGGTIAGWMGQSLGWRSSFYLLGTLGTLLGFVLMLFLREPSRGQSDDRAGELPPNRLRPDFAVRASSASRRSASRGGGQGSGESAVAPRAKAEGGRDRSREGSQGPVPANRPMMFILMAVFVGANFVAAIVLTWMPSFLYRKFGMSLAAAGFSSTAYLQIASVLGVLVGGVLADRLAHRWRGGRMMTQALGLLAGVPFIFVTGWTTTIAILIVAMAGFGFFKGLYDANIWASLHDVVPTRRRATAVGMMNAVGWIGGGIAPVAVGFASERYGLSAVISASSLVYLVVGLLLVLGIRAFMRGGPTIRAEEAYP